MKRTRAEPGMALGIPSRAERYFIEWFAGLGRFAAEVLFVVGIAMAAYVATLG